EVGYRRGRRVALQHVAAPLAAALVPGVEVAEGEPIVATGGARGITAAVLADLARRWRPTLLLIGTSPLPPVEEDPATAGIHSASAMKEALHDRLRGDGTPVRPGDVERGYRAV